MSDHKDGVASVIVKLMTITREEFERSLSAFQAGAGLGPGNRVAVGGAVISFEALPRRRVGGMVSLPQARVMLDVTALPLPERVTFLRRFDIAFQRGGG